ncbi:Free methionine-R-sulfoxide reductase [Orchesella cincta]|uniref:Free methionine-R-sulfoxide reductase n=1 Tax=Orchesella cincta TaxID=48709 RepID=A0A1D2N7N8_ORCCI|nr:Free methionine-R-sulfoxide reductase [Orchesella cincta]
MINGNLIGGPSKVACTEIKFGRGVCGVAASTGQTQVVPNVHEFPGHIACDSSSLSEIVVPIISISSGKVLGVLDIDDEGSEAFGEADKVGMEAVVQVLLHSCDWVE